MNYQKPALSFAEQADRSELVDRLASVNYYRLSAYWYTFRIEGDPDERLIPGTTLATVWKRYVAKLNSRSRNGQPKAAAS